MRDGAGWRAIAPVLEAHGRADRWRRQRLFLVDDAGRQLAGTQALAAITALAMAVNGGGTVAVPVTAPRAFEEIAARYGGKIVRTRATLAALMQTAARNRDMLLLGDGAGNYIFPGFYPIVDGSFAIVKIMELLTLHGARLSQVIAWAAALLHEPGARALPLGTQRQSHAHPQPAVCRSQA